MKQSTKKPERPIAAAALAQLRLSGTAIDRATAHEQVCIVLRIQGWAS